MTDAIPAHQAALEAAWFPDAPPELTAARQQVLLRLAREAILAHVMNRDPAPVPAEDAEILRPAGVFVTLRDRPRRRQATGGASLAADEYPLRGCIGHVPADTPLAQAAQQAAVNAATVDPRFPPVRADEVDRLWIKIAVLSPLQRVGALDEVVIGLHGLLLSGQLRRGLLLPEVPARYGWTIQEFLRNLEQKAGLPRNCWPDKADLYRFVTIEFGEGDDLV